MKECTYILWGIWTTWPKLQRGLNLSTQDSMLKGTLALHFSIITKNLVLISMLKQPPIKLVAMLKPCFLYCSFGQKVECINSNLLGLTVKC